MSSARSQAGDHPSAIRARFVFAFVLLSFGCHARPTWKVHRSLLDAPRRDLPRVTLWLPAAIDMGEMSTHGVIARDAAWSKAAHDNVTSSVRERLRAVAGFEIVDAPTLNAESQRIVDEHGALLASRVGLVQGIGGTTWSWRNPSSDDSLGPGLRFLREQTGAEAALFVFGVCHNSSRARQSTTFIASALVGGSYVIGAGGIALGIVDLETGDVLWAHCVALDHRALDLTDFRHRSEVDAVVDRLLRPYPGLDEYERFRARARSRASFGRWREIGVSSVPIRYDGLEVERPAGWFTPSDRHEERERDDLLISLDGFPFHYIRIATTPTNDSTASPDALAQLALSVARSGVAEYELVESRPLDVAGHTGIRLHVRYRDRFGARYDELRCGFVHSGRLYSLEYAAPSIHYFERDLECFDRLVESVRVESSTP